MNGARKESHLEVSAYLSFKGGCEAAFKFYEEALGAKPGLLFRYADSPMADVVPEGWETKIMHGSVRIGGKLLEGADVPPERYDKPQGFSLSLNVPSADQAESVFGKLGNGGRVLYPIAKTFWSERFGMVVDRFGIPWMITANAERTAACLTHPDLNQARDPAFDADRSPQRFRSRPACDAV